MLSKPLKSITGKIPILTVLRKEIVLLAVITMYYTTRYVKTPTQSSRLNSTAESE